MSDTQFVPRWASPPGDTIREALAVRNLDKETLVEELGLHPDALGALLEGSTPMTIRLADQLALVVGGSVEFWMTRDGQYRADLQRVAADRWAMELPVSDMAAMGWIKDPGADWEDRIDVCLEFFDVEDVASWEEAHASLLAKTRFRSSRTLHANDHAVAAWLRQCEIELSQIDCAPFDRSALEDLLPNLRPLTLKRDPADFLPALRRECSDVGVAFGVVKPPARCPISGVAWRLQSGQPSIALTGRHRTDDHFWFSFFHEAAHLVLHDSDTVYLDEIEVGTEPAHDSDEAEADSFAGELLVPPRYESAVYAARRKPLELRRLSKEIGVSLGVLVGHLQHRGALGYRTRLNRLKHRYKWNGTILEKA